MIKTNCIIAFMLLLFYSCENAIVNKNEVGNDEVSQQKKTKEITPIKNPGNTNLIVQNKSDIIGFWVGMFMPDTDVSGVVAGEFYWDRAIKVNICINKITNEKVSGYSIVAGVNRPFTGEISYTNNTYSFHLKEPGDDKHDGEFKFSVMNDEAKMTGNWHSFKQLKIGKRTFELEKKTFEYKPGLMIENKGYRYIDWNKSKGLKHEKDIDDYDVSYFTTTEDVYKYNASTQILTSKQVSNMSKGDLFILRNAIYARHGYSFKSSQLHAFFDAQDWYLPVTNNVQNQLTEIEKQNISLLLRYEKNASEYYDVFGRG